MLKAVEVCTQRPENIRQDDVLVGVCRIRNKAVVSSHHLAERFGLSKSVVYNAIRQFASDPYVPSSIFHEYFRAEKRILADALPADIIVNITHEGFILLINRKPFLTNTAHSTMWKCRFTNAFLQVEDLLRQRR